MTKLKCLNNFNYKYISNSEIDFFFFQVYPGIILGNGETIQNEEYLRKIGMTNILNTAERHVPVNPAKYLLPCNRYLSGFTDT